jgi:hypothetical protein
MQMQCGVKPETVLNDFTTTTMMQGFYTYKQLLTLFSKFGNGAGQAEWNDWVANSCPNRGI